MSNLKYYNLYMKFVKRAVFGFLLVVGLGYSDRALFSFGLDLAQIETAGIVILTTVVFFYVKIAISYYAKYDALYDYVQTKACDFVADYILNIRNH